MSVASSPSLPRIKSSRRPKFKVIGSGNFPQPLYTLFDLTPTYMVVLEFWTEEQVASMHESERPDDKHLRWIPGHGYVTHQTVSVPSAKAEHYRDVRAEQIERHRMMTSMGKRKRKATT